MPIEQRRSIDGECPRRSERRIAEPHAGPNECVASALLGPEEHVLVDMTSPEVWASGKATGQCRTQPTIRHQLRPQDGGSPATEIDAFEAIAVCAVARQIGKSTQLRRREQAGAGQPRAGTFRFDDVPDAGMAGGETRRAVTQSIPSTSIIE